jgi:hypothetical protein
LSLNPTITGLTSVSATSFTGSLQGSASYATNALSASFATSASLARTAQSASVATTASYATNVQFPQNNVAGASGVTSFFINQDIGLDSSGNRHITWADLLTDIAGTNLASDGDSINLNTTITGLTSVSSTSFSGSFSGSFQGDGSNLTGIAATLLVSGSTGGGTVDLKTQTLSIVGTANEVETSVSGQTVTIGLPNDVTLTGDLTVGGNDIKMNGGTTALTFSGAGDVAVAGDLTVTGNDIKSSTNTVFTLSGQDATVAGNMTVQGDLTVNGSLTNLNVTNVNIEDQMILLASGSATGLDAGIIASSGSLGVGSAMYHDITDHRWSVAKAVASNATSVTPLEYVTTVKLASGTPATQEYGKGEMYINTDDDSVWIYS